MTEPRVLSATDAADFESHLDAAGSHLVYGLTLEIARRGLRTILERRSDS